MHLNQNASVHISSVKSLIDGLYINRTTSDINLMKEEE